MLQIVALIAVLSACACVCACENTHAHDTTQLASAAQLFGDSTRIPYQADENVTYVKSCQKIVADQKNDLFVYMEKWEDTQRLIAFHYRLVKGSSKTMEVFEMLDHVFYAEQIHLDEVSNQLFLDCRTLEQVRVYTGFCMLVVPWPDFNNQTYWIKTNSSNSSQYENLRTRAYFSPGVDPGTVIFPAMRVITNQSQAVASGYQQKVKIGVWIIANATHILQETNNTQCMWNDGDTKMTYYPSMFQKKMVRDLDGKILCAAGNSSAIRIFDARDSFRLLYETVNASAFVDYDVQRDMFLVPINFQRRIDIRSTRTLKPVASVLVGSKMPFQVVLSDNYAYVLYQEYKEGNVHRYQMGLMRFWRSDFNAVVDEARAAEVPGTQYQRSVEPIETVPLLNSDTPTQQKPVSNVVRGDVVNFVFDGNIVTYDPNARGERSKSTNMPTQADFAPCLMGRKGLVCGDSGVEKKALSLDDTENASGDTSLSDSGNGIAAWIITVAAIVLALAVVSLAVLWYRRKRLKLYRLERKLLKSVEEFDADGNIITVGGGGGGGIAGDGDGGSPHRIDTDTHGSDTEVQIGTGVTHHADIVQAANSAKIELTKAEFLSRFTQVRLIGKGGFSSVYEYIDTLTQRRVAVKISSQNDYEEFQTTQQEIRIMMKIQKYPNIVRIQNYVFNYEETVGVSQIFVVMDLADCTLQDILVQKRTSNQRISNEHMIKIMNDLVTVLAQLQEHEHIAHRDVKPSNILVNKDTMEAKLSDFGCSKMYTLTDYSRTRTVIGSPSFLSPQARCRFDYLTHNAQSGADPNASNQTPQTTTSNRSASVGIQADWDFFKADVFSLGLTLLCSATLKGVQGLNEKPRLLEQRLLEFRKENKYSELVQVCIAKMLVWEEQRRPSFAQVRDYIRQHKDTAMAHIQDTSQPSINNNGD